MLVTWQLLQPVFAPVSPGRYSGGWVQAGSGSAGGRPSKHPTPSWSSPGHPAGWHYYSPWQRRRRRRCWRDRRDRSRRGCWGAGSSSAAAAAARRAAHPRCWSRGCCPEPSWCRHRRGARTWGCGAAGGRLAEPAPRTGQAWPRAAPSQGSRPPPHRQRRGAGRRAAGSASPAEPKFTGGVGKKEKRTEVFRAPCPGCRRPKTGGGSPRCPCPAPPEPPPAAGTAGSAATWPSAVPVCSETF